MKPKEITISIEGDVKLACTNYTKAVVKLIKNKFTTNDIDCLIKKIQSDISHKEVR
ncbi:hypothetical protein SAMN05443428_104196 [Caloramator quimbayensis]|uniref:Uncharacterized protein n=1 Tax=Caloramator quimbayensis TaxID=1147123 RepID=A0A1T4WYN4_9CLOT|nr:hypothetical protein [Caloramator quimbayensis]SKA82359.1 hypothetical protein SAMN05443428_104196 [Caloramator quimbayensis]